MKSFVYHLPVALLSAYLALCAWRPPQVSDSIIIVAISALYAFLMYIMFKEVPTVKTNPNLQKMLDQIEDLKLQKDIIGLESHISQMRVKKESGSNGKQKFVF